MNFNSVEYCKHASIYPYYLSTFSRCILYLCSAVWIGKVKSPAHAPDLLYYSKALRVFVAFAGVMKRSNEGLSIFKGFDSPRDTPPFSLVRHIITKSRKSATYRVLEKPGFFYLVSTHMCPSNYKSCRCFARHTRVALRICGISRPPNDSYRSRTIQISARSYLHYKLLTRIFPSIA